jgi:hypothetical protein
MRHPRVRNVGDKSLDFTRSQYNPGNRLMSEKTIAEKPRIWKQLDSAGSEFSLSPKKHRG